LGVNYLETLNVKSKDIMDNNITYGKNGNILNVLLQELPLSGFLFIKNSKAFVDKADHQFVGHNYFFTFCTQNTICCEEERNSVLMRE
jgi:hypothetical protein